MNEKIKKLSSIIVDYSLKVKENDRVLITTQSKEANPLIKQLIRDIASQKAIPQVNFIDVELSSTLLENTSDERVKLVRDTKQFEVDQFDCFISVRYTTNDYENKHVPALTRQKIGKATEDIDDIRINERRWVLLNYPSHLDAYKASMTNDEFFEYALDVMTFDYASMRKDLEPLKKLMEETDRVRIVAPDTDLTFSIKGMPAIPCCGTANIPDGEIYTAPVRDSVNGTLTYNTPSPYQGNVFNRVSLTFENGKIIKATCTEDDQVLNEIFDTDEGARYVGEFSLGINPLVLEPMGDILFDEKIAGSIHFTPGRCYRDCNNGNASAIHWDMVLIQRKDFGGGEIYFDDALIRKDGLFLLPELQHLNYDLK